MHAACHDTRTDQILDIHELCCAGSTGPHFSAVVLYGFIQYPSQVVVAVAARRRLVMQLQNNPDVDEAEVRVKP